MLSRGGKCSKMPCESCAIQFSVFKRKQVCCECERYYCSGCLRREGAYVMCAACKTLSTRPLMRQAIAHLKVRDLQCFLQRQNVSTRGCVEKEELVTLCISHVNSSGFRRRGPRSRSSPFNSFKGFTNHLNVFINNAFDIRTQPQQTPPTSTHSNCYNAAHAHEPAQPRVVPHPAPRERFTTTPGGERDIVVPVPSSPEDDSGGGGGRGGVGRAGSDENSRVDTADCFEIEDLDDSGWEFVSRPAEPLPNDSEVLLAENEISMERERAPATSGASAGAGAGAGADTCVGRGQGAGAEECAGRGSGAGRGRGAWLAAGGAGTPQRAASELELRPRAPSPPAPDSVSLQDEPTEDSTPAREGPVTLSAVSSASDLAALSVRQLKELLGRNRVATAGCLERGDLLERARRLWLDHTHYAAEVDRLPLEECCKICMAAPLECVLLECGHMAACTGCARQLAECPICRTYVVRAVRFFRS